MQLIIKLRQGNENGFHKYIENWGNLMFEALALLCSWALFQKISERLNL